MTLLSPSDRERIEQAVKRFEKQSSTELVVSIVSQSDSYPAGRLLVAFSWSVAAALLLLRFSTLDPSLILALEVPVALVVWALFGVSALGRLLVPAPLAARRVEERAFGLFAERGLYRTRDRTGMLILISEFEHRVVILGDAGIHEHVGDAGWQAHVDHIVRCIKRGETAQGVIEVIERLEAVHSEHLPPRPDDANELPNVIVGDG